MLSTLLEDMVPVQHAMGYFLWRKLKNMLTYVQTLALTVTESIWSEKTHTQLSLGLKEASM